VLLSSGGIKLMAGNPRTVTADTVFTWDGVSTRLAKGQAIDVTPGSALERAIGSEHLVPLGATSALPPAQEAVVACGGGGGGAADSTTTGGGGGDAESALEVSQSAPVKLPAVGAKKQDIESAPAKTDGKTGDP
jgi:hypothetical protein